MAFASSLFCSSKFLESTHTLTKHLTVLACSDNTKDVRTPPPCRSEIAPRMAFASSLFCSSKFLESTHTLTKHLTVLACSDNTKDVRTPPPFRFFMSKYWLDI